MILLKCSLQPLKSQNIKLNFVRPCSVQTTPTFCDDNLIDRGDVTFFRFYPVTGPDLNQYMAFVLANLKYLARSACSLSMYKMINLWCTLHHYIYYFIDMSLVLVSPVPALIPEHARKQSALQSSLPSVSGSNK